jgi:hypothetical protein
LHSNVTPESEMLIHSYSFAEDDSTSERMENNLNYKGCLGYKSMATLEERLKIWIEAHCLEKNPRPQRVFELNVMLREIYNDRRFWKYRNQGNRNYYEDALSKMWDYFFLNLCETTTARRSGPFLKTCDYAVGRLLVNLKGHLKNIEKHIRYDMDLYEEPHPNGDGTFTHPIDKVSYPEPGLMEQYFNALVELLETDPTGELNDKANTLEGTKTTQGPYKLTAQSYLLMKYRDGMTILDIAEKLSIPRGSVLGGKMPTKWKELKRKYDQIAKEQVLG